MGVKSYTLRYTGVLFAPSLSDFTFENKQKRRADLLDKWRGTMDFHPFFDSNFMLIYKATHFNLDPILSSTSGVNKANEHIKMEQFRNKCRYKLMTWLIEFQGSLLVTAISEKDKDIHV